MPWVWIVVAVTSPNNYSAQKSLSRDYKTQRPSSGNVLGTVSLLYFLPWPFPRSEGEMMLWKLRLFAWGYHKQNGLFWMSWIILRERGISPIGEKLIKANVMCDWQWDLSSLADWRKWRHKYGNVHPLHRCSVGKWNETFIYFFFWLDI